MEWSIAMLTSLIEEGMAEGSTEDKGALVSEVVGWSAVVIASTKDEATSTRGA
jgi:hypothetical protein